MCSLFINVPHVLGNGPHVLGNVPHVLGNGPHVLGIVPHVLGNGPHVLGIGPYADMFSYANRYQTKSSAKKVSVSLYPILCFAECPKPLRVR